MDLGDDSDVKLLKVSGGLFDTYFDQLPNVLYADDDDDENGEKTLLLHNDRRAVERLVQLVSRSVLRVTGELLPPHHDPAPPSPFPSRPPRAFDYSSNVLQNHRADHPS